MKHFISILLLFVSINAVSQSLREHTFDNYYMKKTGFNNDRPVIMNQTIKITDADNGLYHIKVFVETNQSIQTTAKFKRQFEFIGKTIYEYRGSGLFGNEPMNFTIESYVKLSDLSKGIGYVRNSNDKLSAYEVRFSFWEKGIEEPLLKNNFHLYPIKNTDKATIEKQKVAKEDYRKIRREIDSIKKIYVNIDDYVDGYTERTSSNIEQSAVKNLKIEKLLSNRQIYKEIKTTFYLILSAEHSHSAPIGKIKVTKNIGHQPEELNEAIKSARLPYVERTHKGRKFSVNRRTFYQLDYDIIIGEVTVRNRGKAPKFVSKHNLTESQKQIIIEELRNRKKGKYKITYSFGTINNTNADKLHLKYIPPTNILNIKI